jgi:hypothetical protein
MASTWVLIRNKPKPRPRGAKAFVELKDLGSGFVAVKAGAIVGKANTDPAVRAAGPADGDVQRAVGGPVLEGIGEQVIKDAVQVSPSAVHDQAYG